MTLPVGYDPEARRDTPLARKLKERIRSEGPITVAEYMQVCLQDPEHGDYRTKTAIGAQGDFTTAPEISQVFGELIGLWCAVVWRQMGSPARLNLVEVGPGRGTLMRDALRAAKVVPGLRDAIALHLVETSMVLRHSQAKTLAGVGCEPRWIEALLAVGESGPGGYATRPDLPMAPTLLIANELLDARPVRQLECHGGLWFERTVYLDHRCELAFGRSLSPAGGVGGRGDRVRPPAEGDIVEVSEGLGDITAPLAAIAVDHPVAALFIDYGYVAPATGATLQAVRLHVAEHPLTSPGEADLSALVDFGEASQAFTQSSFAVDGPVTQAEFLGSLGIVERASKLMAANPAKTVEIEMGVARLMAVPGMGNRFKAMGVRSAGLPPLPGFPAVDKRRSAP